MVRTDLLSGQLLLLDHEQVEYCIGKDLTEVEDSVRATAGILAVLGELSYRAEVDLFSDRKRQMPPDVRAVEEELIAIDARRGARPGSQMALDLTLTDPHERHLFEKYAAWSINADVFDRNGAWIATFHDSGYSLSFEMDDGQRSALAQLLPDLPVMSIKELRMIQHPHRARLKQLIARVCRDGPP